MNYSLKGLTSYILILVSLLLFIACGNGDSSPEEIYIVQAGLTCTEELKDILDKDVHSSIDCVKDSLDQFASSVKLKNPNYIERQELTSFLERYFPDSFDLANDLLKLIYNVNTLLFSDPIDQISLTNIPNLFTIAHLVNDHGRVLKSYITDIDKVNYWQRRDALFKETEAIASKLSSLISPYNFSSRKLNIMTFIEDLKNSLDLSDEQMDLELISASLFGKKMILGGEKDILTSPELNNLLKRLPDVLILALDALFYEGKAFVNNEEKFFFYFDIINEVMSNLAELAPTEVIINHSDIVVIAKKVIDEKYDFDLLEESLINIKKKVLGGDHETYTYSQTKYLFSLLKQVSGLLYFTETTYTHFSKRLASPNQILNLRNPNIASYSVFTKKEINHHWKIFNYITKNYRYFPDQNGSIIFDNNYHRTPHGFSTIALFKWGINELMQLYGTNVKNDRRKVATKDQLNLIMQDAKGILKEFIYWPNDYDGFLGETITNSDLFQFRSNGNDVADTDEITEYLLTVLHSFDLAEQIHNTIKKDCSIVDSELESFDMKCFRESFYPTFFKRLSFESFYPELYSYNKQAGEKKLRTYFFNIEAYARFQSDDAIPMSSEELSRLIVIISSIEGIYIKFDFNKDGKLSSNELDQAFVLFKGLIQGVIDLDPDSNLYHSIFFYIIKNMKEPSPLQLLWFHTFGNKDAITSTRFNIASALSAFLGN